MDPLWPLEYLMVFLSMFVTIFVILVYLLNEGKMKEEKPALRLPKVTVLVPAYNEEEYIGGALDSILALDYPKDKLEVIVLNDGSTDRTVQVVRKSARYGVKLVNKKNTGKADSLNRGVAMANGELIATMDADSYVTPSTMKKMVAYFEDPKVASVASSVYVQGAKGLLGTIQQIEYMFAIFSRRIIEFVDCITVTPGPFSMFRRSSVLEVGGFDPQSLVEDQEIALNLQKHGYLIRTAPGAKVFSEIPKTFSELKVQRIRWQTGGFYNALKYKSMIGLKHGDLGLITLPYLIFGYATVALIPIFLIMGVLTGSVYSWAVGWEGVRLGFGAIHFLSLFMGLFLFCWIYFGMKRHFPEEKFGAGSVLIFLSLYPLLTFAFWLFVAYRVALKQKRSW